MKTKNFSVVIDDKELKFYVASPSIKDQKEAQKIYTSTFNEAIKSGSIVRARLDDIMMEQGLWDQNKQAKFDTLQREILDSERTLDKGGIPLATAKEIALKMRQNRAELRELISDRTSLDTHSAEGQGESQRFNYFVYACTFCADTNKKYYTCDYDTYISDNDDPVSIVAAQNLANLMYGLDEDFEKKLPENDFLIKYKFVNQDLHFIDKKGRLTDGEGRLVNEKGRYIDEEGNYVDKYGNKIDEEGNYDVEFKPFLDDAGNPIILDDSTQNEEESTEEKKPAKKKSKPKKEDPETA